MMMMLTYIIVTYLFYCLPVVVFDDTFDDMHEEGLESIPSDGRSVQQQHRIRCSIFYALDDDNYITQRNKYHGNDNDDDDNYITVHRKYASPLYHH